VLDDKSRPQPVQRTLIRPPESQIGPLTEEERQQRISRSPLAKHYETCLDRESAFELLKERADKLLVDDEQLETERAKSKSKSKTKSTSNRQSPMEAFIKSAARAIGSQIGRRVIRGILGSIFSGR